MGKEWTLRAKEVPVHCPYCGKKGMKMVKVRERLANKDKDEPWVAKRYRFCSSCKKKFQTLEMVIENFLSVKRYQLVLTGLRELLQEVPANAQLRAIIDDDNDN